MIKGTIQNFFVQKGSKARVITPSEHYSRYTKKAAYESGRSIVSDRDVGTLSFFLSLYCSQTLGKRLIDKAFFPYWEKTSDLAKVKLALNLFEKFPDPFLERELFEVLQDYFSSSRDYKVYQDLFEFSDKWANQLRAQKLFPRSAVSLFLNDFPVHDQTALFEGHLKKLPLSFSQNFPGQVFGASSLGEWRDQVALYDLVMKQNKKFKFHNFHGQQDEVRFALEQLKISQEQGENLAVFYPPQKGYEKLFYLYQREFFEEQVFFFGESEEFFLDEFLQSLRKETQMIDSYYSGHSENKNYYKVQDLNQNLFTFEEVLQTHYRKKPTSLDINLFSDLLKEISLNQKFSQKEWLELFEKVYGTQVSRGSKFKTEVLLGDYNYLPTENVDSIYILGWSDQIFRTSGDAIFSHSVLNGLERDLGVELPSLRSCPARDLFNNPVVLEKLDQASFLYSAKSISGESSEPGVLKTLMDSSGWAEPPKRAVLNNQEVSLERQKLKFESGSLSATSLQNYDECPYVFYLEKVLGLRDKEDEDYFLSYLEDGLLTHALMERLTDEEMSKDKFIQFSQDFVRINDEVDHFRLQQAKILAERIWPYFQEEREYLKEENIKVLAAEKKFSFYANPETKEIQKTSGVGSYRLMGYIDRVDLSQDQKVLLYDYKRGEGGTSLLVNYNGKKLAPQMFLYCLAVDGGFLGEFKNLVSFQFVNMQKYKRSKGFVLKGLGEDVVKEVSYRSAVDEETLNQKISLFMEKFWTVLENIKKGKFQEQPGEPYPQRCFSCEWVGICKKSQTFI